MLFCVNNPIAVGPYPASLFDFYHCYLVKTAQLKSASTRAACLVNSSWLITCTRFIFQARHINSARLVPLGLCTYDVRSGGVPAKEMRSAEWEEVYLMYQESFGNFVGNARAVGRGIPRVPRNLSKTLPSHELETTSQQLADVASA